MIITRKSPFSGITHSLEVDVSAEEIRVWESGVNIQTAMPYVPAALREFIMTGITPEEWNKTFGTGDNDGEERSTDKEASGDC